MGEWEMGAVPTRPEAETANGDADWPIYSASAASVMAYLLVMAKSKAYAKKY